jgi:hypothetical protein
MAVRQFQPILGKRMRITPLDECGRFPASAAPNGFLSTSGFVTVTMSAEIESGQEVISRRADGSICVNFRGPDSFKRLTVGVTLCGVDPQVLAAMTNAEPYVGYTAADIIGMTLGEGTVEAKFALELWTGISGAACDPAVDEASGYLLLPFVNAGTLGDLEVNGTDAVNFAMNGGYTRSGNAWGVGPYNVLANGSNVASKLPTALDANDHLLLVETGIAPPPEANGWQAAPTVPPPPAWPATHAYVVGDKVLLTGGARLNCTVAGTSSGTQPTAPVAIGGIVTDGGVTWQRYL